MSMLLWVGFAFGAETAELARQWGPSVVTLETVDLLGRRVGNGTGFLVSTDGLLVTNAHVVEGQVSRARFADGTTRDVEGLVALDEEADVAILKVEGGGYRPFTLRTGVTPTVGERVVVIGSPTGLDQTVTDGTISAVRPEGLPPEEAAREDEVARASLLQITAPIAPGSSGSPVLDTTGEVVGIAQSASNLSDIYIAVDIVEVVALRDALPPNPPVEPIRTPTGDVAWAVGGLVGVAGIALLLGRTPQKGPPTGSKPGPGRSWSANPDPP